MSKGTIEPGRIKRVVVQGTSWVGDAVMSVPALRELRRLLPDAEITLISRSGTADIFEGADFIDDLLIFNPSGLRGFWNEIKEWRKRQFDLAVFLQNAFQPALIAFIAGVPARIGYATDRRGILLTHPIPLPAWKDERHEVFYYRNLIAELEQILHGTTSIESNEPQFSLAVSAERKERARALLREHGTAAGAPVILICPGSINSRAKRWPAERYGALADRFIETGASVALIGSPAESDVSAAVRANMKEQPTILTGKTTMAEAAAIISIADVLITNDTGPAHIGSAVGTPTLVIFGPTNPLTTRPFAPSADIVRRPPDCAPCMLRDCPIDHRCMTAITPEEVFQHAIVLISARAEVST